MNCVDLKALWNAWADGELSREMSGEIAAHVSACESCRAWDMRMRALDEALDVIGDEVVEPPPFMMTRVMARLDEGRTPFAERLLGFFAPRRIGAYALVAATFATGMVTMDVISSRRGAPEVVASRIVLEFDAPNGEKVGLIGDFNDWGKKEVPIAAKVSDGKWQFELDVPPGRYQYAFEVNGKKWLPDPNAKGIIPDGFGGINSVLYVSPEAAQKTN